MHPTDPHSRSGAAARDSALMTKVLAVLLLLVAGALVFTVLRQRTAKPEIVYEPRAVTLPSGDLGADEKARIAVFESASPSVVHITNIAVRRNEFTMDITEIPRGTGSGFVWDEQGHIVTNYHVVADAQTARVTLADGTTYDGKVLGAAPDKDIAVVKIDAPPSKLKKIAIGDSSELRVGQSVLAIGNPFGLDQTLTTGVISGLGREIKSVTQRTIYDVIQTDAPINPGNSGGPLLDSHGRLIGVNTAIYSPTGASAGIGFAVPVSTVNRMVPQILQYKRIVRPVMGVNLASDQVAKQLNVKGVIVQSVVPGGPAGRGGVVGMTRGPDGGWVLGDVLVQIDGVAVTRADDLFQVLDKRKIGDEVALEVVNAGRSRTVRLKLEAAP
ncbi:MAG TPA: trypsin-like peptidase domain-containing protein [Kofleriaceae bacterium]|nr:trypsin-like peptidase domain-containing protein [Kofleriaceae bacterium]